MDLISCFITTSQHTPYTVKPLKILFYGTKHFQLITQDKLKKNRFEKNIENLIFEVLRVALLEVSCDADVLGK